LQLKLTSLPDGKLICARNHNRYKSEVFIDMALFTNNIPFRYECALELGHSTLYPDFTIRHPKTGEICYWEHFGLMDDPSYRNYQGILLVKQLSSRFQYGLLHSCTANGMTIITHDTGSARITPQYPMSGTKSLASTTLPTSSKELDTIGTM